MIALVYVNNPTRPTVWEGTPGAIADDLRAFLVNMLAADSCDVTIRVANAGEGTVKVPLGS